MKVIVNKRKSHTRLVATAETTMRDVRRFWYPDKYLPHNIVDRLVKERPYWRDLSIRLKIMPVLDKGRRVGEMTGDTVVNAIRTAEKYGIDLYHGYFIRSTRDVLTIDTHTFAVFNGTVIECSAEHPWDNHCYYVGVPIQPLYYDKHRFIRMFERMDFIREALSLHDQKF